MDYIQRKRSLEVKEFFASSFRNQDLYYAELDGVADDESFYRRLQVVSSGLGKFIQSEAVIVHLEETKMTPPRLADLVLVLKQNETKIKKLSLVGLHGLDVLRLRWKFQTEGVSRRLGCRIINDLQQAKEWMVTHRG